MLKYSVKHGIQTVPIYKVQSMNKDRHTPDNEEPIKDHSKGNLCRVFTESARLGGNFTLRDTDISVSMVLDSMDKFGTQKTIKRFNGAISEKDIKLCQTIAAHYIAERPEFQRNGQESDVTIFLDENVPHRIIPALLNNSARIAHISFHNLTTQSDPKIWDFTKQNGFQAFITNDSDFIQIAELETLQRLQKTGSFGATQIADLPFVIKIDGSAKEMTLTERSLRAQMKTIVQQATDPDRRLAWGVLSRNHLAPGNNIEEIYHKHIRPSLEGTKMFVPAFDTKILDHLHIDKLRSIFEFESLPFTQSKKWRRFYDRAYQARQRAMPESDPSASPS